MRVLVDGVAFQNDYQRGIQRYFTELFTRVSSQCPVDLFLSSPAKSRVPDGCNLIHRKEWFAAHRANLPGRVIKKLRRSFTPTRFSGHTVFHSTFFTPSPEPGLSEVVTLYDMIPERFGHLSDHDQAPHIAEKLRSLEAAARIICISHATAADLVAKYPQFASKQTVIHLGAGHLSNSRVDPAGEAVGVKGAYILFVGDRAGYKNFDSVILAVAEAAWPKGVTLVAVGGRSTAQQAERIKTLGLTEKFRFEGFVSDERLRDYYRQCVGFIFPALCEGFGFPLLEAQSLKVPVLCSDIPVFREVGGDSPLFFDPQSSASIAAAVQKLASISSAQTEAHIQAGLRNVNRFGWDECARRTEEIYRQLSINN